jgi:hypothetical protein
VRGRVPAPVNSSPAQPLTCPPTASGGKPSRAWKGDGGQAAGGGGPMRSASIAGTKVVSLFFRPTSSRILPLLLPFRGHSRPTQRPCHGLRWGDGGLLGVSPRGARAEHMGAAHRVQKKKKALLSFLFLAPTPVLPRTRPPGTHGPALSGWSRRRWKQWKEEECAVTGLFMCSLSLQWNK